METNESDIAICKEIKYDNLINLKENHIKQNFKIMKYTLEPYENMDKHMDTD